MAGERMGGGRVSARHSVAEDLEGWMREDDGLQDDLTPAWPPDPWAPDAARTSGREPDDVLPDADARDDRGVEHRDGWGATELTARTGRHDDRPASGWPRRGRPRTDRAAEEGLPAENEGYVALFGDDDGQDARERRRRAGENLFRLRASRAPGGLFDDPGFGEPLPEPAEDRAVDRRAGVEPESGERDERDGRAYDDPGYDGFRHDGVSRDGEVFDRLPGEHGDPEYAAPDESDPAARTIDEGPLGVDPAFDRHDGGDPPAGRPGPGEPGRADEPRTEALGPVLAEFAARRRAAEETAASAEAVAAAAAERAAAAIAAAAKAADEAEAAADAAARAAEDAVEAAEAERRAVAAAGGQVPSAAPDPLDDADRTARVPLGPQAGVHSAPPGVPVPPGAPAGPGRHGPPPGARRPPHPGPPPGMGRAPGQSGSWRRPPMPPGPGQGRGWLPDGAATVAGMPVAGGRAARRRAAEVSDPMDAESTEVLTGLHALREPSGDAPVPGSAEATAVTRVRPSRHRDDQGEPDERDLHDLDDDGRPLDEDDVDEDHDREPVGWAARLPARPVLAAVAVVVALVVVTVVALLTSGSGAAPQPKSAGAGTTSAAPPPATGAPAVPAVDPRSKQAVAFLTALRDADVPTSRSGQAETEAAAVICQQLAQGANETSIVRTLPAVLPDLTRAQAAEVVELAQQHYC
jgi:hypothetical protein